MQSFVREEDMTRDIAPTMTMVYLKKLFEDFFYGMLASTAISIAKQVDLAPQGVEHHLNALKKQVVFTSKDPPKAEGDSRSDEAIRKCEMC